MVVDAALVDIEACLHVVEGVAHAAEALPEEVVKLLLGLGGELVELSRDVARGVHGPDCGGGALQGVGTGGQRRRAKGEVLWEMWRDVERCGEM